MGFRKRFLSLPIRNRMLASYLTLFLVLLLGVGIGVDILLRTTIERHVRSEFRNTTRTIHNLVQTAGSVSIKHHLRTIVQTNLIMMESLDREVKKGNLTLKEAQDQARNLLRLQTIGKTGYLYVIDSLGILRHHKDDSLLGEDVSGYAFVQEQKRRKNGYLEYDWRNPGEPAPRAKALFMEYFSPWDWVVSASSYREEFRDLIQIQDFQDAILALRFGETGYAILLDSRGELLVHPILPPQNVRNWTDLEDRPIFKEILASQETSLRYLWQNPEDPAPRRKILLSTTIPELHLIVAVTGYLDEFYAPLTRIRRLMTIGFFITLSLLIPLTILLSRSITRPIEALTATLGEAAAGDFSIRTHVMTGGEPGVLASYFNAFMDHIQESQRDLEKENQERKKSEAAAAMLAKFPDENPNPVLRVDGDGTLRYINQAARRNLSQWPLHLDQPIPEFWQATLADCRKCKTGSAVEVEAGDHAYRFTASRISHSDAVYLYGQEITGEKAYQSLMLLSDSVFEHTIEGMTVTDAKGTIERVNPAFTAITGYSAEEAIGSNPRILKSRRHPREFYTAMWESLLHRGEWSGEIWNRRKNGQAYPEWLSITAVRNDAGETIRYVGLFHDITELKTNREELRFQTYHDALTGLPNRRLLTDRLERALAHSHQHAKKLATIFIDMDNFKHINDSLGHLTGDLFLKQLADRFRTHIPEDGTIARFAGDKFVVVIPEIPSENDAITAAARIQNAFSQPFIVEEREYFASASIGIALFPQDGETEDELLRNAETAMYRAKNTGKNRVALFAPDMNANALERMEMETRLRKAVENDEFHLVYQPKVDLTSGRIIGAEALIRWEYPAGTFTPPDVFIPIAEETGLILPIGKRVLEMAAAEAARWEQQGFSDLSVAVNLSAVQFQDPGLLEEVRTIMESAGLAPDAMELEITESVVMEDAASATATMEKFAQLGIRFSIDDFGTGYSSLAYLKRFPIHILKIDRSFVKEIPEDRDDSAIVLSILSLARSLGLKVVAEGVETDPQLTFLRTSGCDMIQGYLFSRPLPPDAFLSLVREGHRLREVRVL